MATKGKPKGKKKVAAKDLSPKHAASVKGGRKAGEKPVEYLTIKMNDALITG